MKKYIVICILSSVAFVNAFYLSYKSYAPDTSSFCDINSVWSCGTVLASPASKIAGIIAFPAVAMVVYPVLFGIAYYGYKNRSRKQFRYLAILSALGILFNGYFIYLENFVIGAFCPLCILCTGIIVAIFVLSMLGRRKPSLG